MARFSSFLGRRVEVQYRASDTLLPASGVFVADSGRSIFLEQSFEQRGQHRHFRWEIPYQHLVRIGLAMPEEEPPSPSRTRGERASANISASADIADMEAPIPAAEASPHTAPKEKASSAAAGIALVASVLPMSNPPETA